MKAEYVKIIVDAQSSVSGVLGVPRDLKYNSGIILAHGAHNDMNQPLIRFIHEDLARRGYLTLKFNFLYRELGRKKLDSLQDLMNCYKKAIQLFIKYGNDKINHLFIGGKSLGGRIASYLAEEIPLIKGLIFLGYPLHKPGKTEEVRDKHLYAINKPMLFLAGTKDSFAQRDLLEKVISKLSPRAYLHLIPEGNHSFRLPKDLSRSQKEVYQEISQIIYQWIKGIVQ